MDEFEPYVLRVEWLARQVLNMNDLRSSREEILETLDGRVTKELRAVIPVATLRKMGAFFTSPALATKLLRPLGNQLKRRTTILDPACGAGDLLLACARDLPMGKDLETTLVKWGKILRGFDISAQFVRVTKARLLLLAVERGAKVGSYKPKMDSLFENIRVIETLGAKDAFLGANLIVVNPPYGTLPAPSTCSWAAGDVSQAALFIEKLVVDAVSGTDILAILPDVLRTGSRYARWRSHIEQHATVNFVENIGLFDEFTDIDVFITHMSVGENSRKRKRSWWRSRTRLVQSSEKIADFFDVNVGSVVPYRDAHKGPVYPYLDVHELPKWTTYQPGSATRRFSGTTFTPPFVVVRRTSRPGDSYRAVGTLIIGKSPVAVENHLMVLKPLDGSLTRCQELLRILRSESTNAWLNERIRCRHLTVTSLSELPWWKNE
jgi:hypothetical protein